MVFQACLSPQLCPGLSCTAAPLFSQAVEGLRRPTYTLHDEGNETHLLRKPGKSYRNHGGKNEIKTRNICGKQRTVQDIKKNLTNFFHYRKRKSKKYLPLTEIYIRLYESWGENSLLNAINANNEDIQHGERVLTLASSWRAWKINNTASLYKGRGKAIPKTYNPIPQTPHVIKGFWEKAAPTWPILEGKFSTSSKTVIFPLLSLLFYLFSPFHISFKSWPRWGL